MESLYLAFEVVFPILAYMMIGFAAAKKKIWDEKTALNLNKLIFTVFLPVLLFENIRSISLDQQMDIRLLVFVLISVAITFGALFILVPRLEKDNSRRGVMVQGIYRSNYIIIGIPMTQTILGRENIGYTAALIAIIIPLFNIMAIIAMEIFRESRIRWSRILKSVLKNPFVIAAVLGFGMFFAGISLPSYITAVTVALGRASTPMALAAMGGCFRFAGAKECLRPLVITTVGKLVVMPGVWLTAAALLGFRDQAYVSLLSLYGAPVAVSSYTIAQQMGGDSELASQVVVYTAIASIFTLFLITFITKSLGLY